MFNEKAFKESLKTKWLGQSFWCFDELPSTNSYAKFLPQKTTKHGTVVFTDYQTAGRGQRSRSWTSLASENLTFSIVLKPENGDRLMLLTLVIAYAVKEAIQKYLNVSTQLKWPNDILCNERKLCGILTETQFTGSRLDKVIVGIGLNVNQSEFDKELSEKATSLLSLTGKNINREKLLCYLLQEIESCYEKWFYHDSEIIRQVNKSLIGCGEWVRLEIDEKKTEDKYKFIGVNDSGAFMALNPNMDVQTFTHEQVRIAGSE